MTEQTIPEQGREARAKRRVEQEGNLPALKLMLATPYYMSQEFSTYGDSMLATARMLTEAQVPWQKQSIRGDSYVDRCKNTLVANFLESDCTDLLMIDSDLEFSAEAAARMLRHPQEIVAGFFPMKNRYNTFAGALEPDAQGNIPDTSSAIELWDGTCLLKAHLLPGGFIRFKRAALERYADYYDDRVYVDPCADPARPDRVYTAFFECMIHDNIRFGEDATFCRRAREMGMDLWCDPAITFSHYGVTGYTGNYHESLLKPEDELAEIREQREEMAKMATAHQIEVAA